MVFLYYCLQKYVFIHYAVKKKGQKNEFHRIFLYVITLKSPETRMNIGIDGYLLKIH